MRANTIRTICILAAVLISFTAAAALASGTAVELPDLKLAVEVPSGWTVLTRDMPDENDPVWQQAGLTKGKWLDEAERADAYLNALSQDRQSEIIITMKQDKDIHKAYDLSLLDNDALDDFEDEQITQRERAGKTVTRLQRFHHSQAVFLVIDETEELTGGTAYSREYVTIINGMGITIVMKSRAGKVSGDVGAALLYVMDSLVFTEVTERPGFDYSTILYGMVGIFLFIGFALALRIRSRKKKGGKKGKDDDKPSGFKNKYTRW